MVADEPHAASARQDVAPSVAPLQLEQEEAQRSESLVEGRTPFGANRWSKTANDDDLARGWELLTRTNRYNACAWRPSYAQFLRQVTESGTTAHVGYCMDDLTDYGLCCIAVLRGQSQVLALSVSCRVGHKFVGATARTVATDRSRTSPSRGATMRHRTPTPSSFSGEKP